MVTLPATLDPEIYISWDGTGLFDGDNDRVTDSTSPAGITIDEGLNGSRELNPPKVSASSVTLHNSDGAFSQDRPDSPVYQRVLPGRQVKVTGRQGVRRLYRDHVLYRENMPYRGRAVYPMLLANISDISQTTEIGNQSVTFDLLGIEHLLTGTPISVPVMANPRVDQCISAILDAVNWPADKRQISVADTTLLYWWADERQPWPALVELQASEGPCAMFVKSGVFYFQNRNYRATATRSTTSQVTLYDRVSGARTSYRDHVLYRDHRLYRGRTSGYYFTAFRPDLGFSSVRNAATYATKRRTLAGSPSVIWSYGAAFTLGSGQSRTLIARPSSGNPFQIALTPVLTTDYTVSGGTVSMSLSATSGLVAFITVTATSGTPTVTGLQLRAQPLTVVSETTVQNAVDASGSVTKFSPIPGQDIPRPLQVAGWPEMDVAVAEAVCDSWINRYQVPRPSVTVRLENADAAHLRLILETQISDRWTLIEENTGYSDDVWVNSKRITISGAGGRKIVAEFGCERIENLSGFTWDGPTSLWDSALWGT